MNAADRSFLDRVQAITAMSGLAGLKGFATLELAHAPDCNRVTCQCEPPAIITEVATGNKFLVEAGGEISKGH